jgi:DNA-binding transcriptional ArsR family regulator
MEPGYDDLANVFKALAHPVRLQILDLLRGGELCVCHIEAALNKRQAYISQQLMALREAGLVESRREGLQVYYRNTDPRIDRLLILMRGTPAKHGHTVIDGCPCPTCATIALAEIN